MTCKFAESAVLPSGVFPLKLCFLEFLVVSMLFSNTAYRILLNQRPKSLFVSIFRQS